MAYKLDANGKRIPELKPIFALDAIHIPGHLHDDCLDIDDEFPLHYATGIVTLEDDGNPFVKWIKTIGFQFPKGKTSAPLAVWGT